MTLEGKRLVVGALGFLFLLSLIAVTFADVRRRRAEEGHKPPVVPADSKACVECHARVTPLAVAQWSESKHGEQGISCVACHGATEGAPDGYMHHDVKVTSIVSPKKCGGCHAAEFEEMAKSGHGRADPALKVALKDGKPDPASWPAPAAGRTNPDGSGGSCASCHGRHRFERADASRPEVCESCHASAAAAWHRSPHAAFFVAKGETGDTPKGESCAGCHLLAAGNTPRTHDSASRVTWHRGADGKMAQVEGADARRDAMFEVCLRCHGNGFAEGAFQRIDDGFAAGKAGEEAEAWPHARRAR